MGVVGGAYIGKINTCLSMINHNPQANKEIIVLRLVHNVTQQHIRCVNLRVEITEQKLSDAFKCILVYCKL